MLGHTGARDERRVPVARGRGAASGAVQRLRCSPQGPGGFTKLGGIPNIPPQVL